MALEQGRVADKYARLEQLMLKMAELEGQQNPKRAQLLTRAVEQSKERLTKTQLESLVTLLNQKQLKRAVDGQAVVQTDLKALLELLMSEDRSDRLKSEQQRIKEYIKEVERLIRLERSIQGQTEANAESRRLAQEQARIAAQTGDLSKKIRENEEGGEQKPEDGDQKSDDQKSDDPKSEEENSDSQKSEDGQKSEGQKSDAQKSNSPKGKSAKAKGEKSGEKAKGEEQPGDKNQGEKSEPGEKNQQSEQNQPGEKGQQQPGEQGQKGDKRGKGEKGSKGQKGAKGQKGQEGKQGEQQPNEGEQGEQPESDQQQDDQSQNPARKRLDQAQQRMQQAQKKLEESKHKESLEDQRAARAELEKAKAQLEEILRQLREEEIARTLAQLEARFRKMLEMQLAVYESTQRLEKLPADKRGEPFLIQAGKLSADEKKIALEAQKALSLLEEEGSSIAFPATVEQMHGDMQQVADRLADAKADSITVGIEEDIIAALEELIAALQQAQRDQEQKKQEQQEQQQQQSDDEEPLVDQIAELKMIKSLQERVNKRTQRYSKLLADETDPVGQAEAPDLAAAVRQLGDRQQEIFRITRDIVLGKNQ